MTVVLSFWNREFFNSLQDKDFDAFFELLFVWRRTPSGFMPGFCEIAAVYILVAVYFTYLSQWLQIRWRRWLTVRFLDEWLADRAYYRISLTTDRAAIGTDNPDQRIAEDIRDFVDNTLTLGISIIANVVTLFSFLGILWSLSGPVTLLGIDIPGYMVWVALAYAIVGTWLTHLVGRPLAALHFRQQRVEADFRYSLVRVRENVEGIALYAGEAEEKTTLGHRFGSVIGNWWAIMQRTKMLNALTAGYEQVAVIFPFIVAAPRFFSGQIPLGGLTQTAGAFGRVQDALSWFISRLSRILAHGTRPSSGSPRSIAPSSRRAPPSAQDWRWPMRRTDRCAARRHARAAERREAADRTWTCCSSRAIPSLSPAVRAPASRRCSARIAGIWPFGTGRVQRPAERCLFLPQRPYIPLGSLRHVISYPHPHDLHSREEIARALEDAGLPQLVAAARRRRELAAAAVRRRAAARGAGARPAGEAGLAVPGRGDRQPRSGGRGRAVSHAEGAAAEDDAGLHRPPPVGRRVPRASPGVPSRGGKVRRTGAGRTGACGRRQWLSETAVHAHDRRCGSAQIPRRRGLPARGETPAVRGATRPVRTPRARSPAAQTGW